MNFIKQPEKENYSKDFRAYREIDNFAENFITCSLTLQNDSNIFNKGICGLCYGGLELPIIMKSIGDRISDVSILKFNKNVTGYAKKQWFHAELQFQWQICQWNKAENVDYVAVYSNNIEPGNGVY